MHSYMKSHCVFFCFLRAHPSFLVHFVIHLTKLHRVLLPRAMLGYPRDAGCGWEGSLGTSLPPAAAGMSPLCGAPGNPKPAPVAQVHSKPGKARLWRGRQTPVLTVSFSGLPLFFQPGGAGPRRERSRGPWGGGAGGSR